MSDDRRVPVPVPSEPMVHWPEGWLPPLFEQDADGKSTRYVGPHCPGALGLPQPVVSTFDAGMIATQRALIEELTAERDGQRRHLDHRNGLIRSLTDKEQFDFDVATALMNAQQQIIELTAERDSLRVENQRAADALHKLDMQVIGDPHASACVHHAEWPAFPASALRNTPWKPVI
jgi:hypothetical protein